MPWESWLTVDRLSDDLENAWAASGIHISGFRHNDDGTGSYRIRYDKLARAKQIMRDWQLTRSWWGRLWLRLRARQP